MNPKGIEIQFLTIINLLVPGSKLFFLFFSLQWIPFHFSAISMLHIFLPCVSPLFELERISPLLLCSTLISQSEIPWLTAVPDGIITPQFHSQLAQEPPLVEVAVPLPCPRISINTNINIWQCYVILYLWGHKLRWSPRKFSFSLFLWWFNLTKAWFKDCFPICSIYKCTYRNALEMTVPVLSWYRWENYRIGCAWNFKAPGMNIKHDTLACLIFVHVGLWQCSCSCIGALASLCVVQFTQCYIFTFHFCENCYSSYISCV